MANNDLIFNAAIQGATGGAAQRWLTKQAEADYDDLSAQIVVFATAVDAEIPADPTITQGDADLMALICNGVMAERWPAAFTSLNLVNVALAVKAMWGRLKSETTPIAPVLSLLSHVYYADADAAAGGDGNIETPFNTLADAIAAIQADPSPTLSVILATGTFTEDVEISVAGFHRISSVAPNVNFVVNGELNILGVAGINVVIENGQFDAVTMEDVPTLIAVGTAFTDTFTSDGSVELTDCSVVGAATIASGSFTDTVFESTLTIDGVASANVWKNVEVLGNASAQELIAEDCTFAIDFTTAGNTTLVNCTIGNDATLGNTSAVDRCTFGNDLDITTGVLTIKESDVDGALTSTSDIVATELHVNGNTSCQVLTATDCNFDDTVECTQLARARSTVFAAVSITDAGSNEMEGCEMASVAGVALSTLSCDSYSASWSPVTGGITRTVRAPRATLAVNVPALAANAIGTVAVALTGTNLEGLTTGNPVVAVEPTAGVTGGGFLCGVRVTSTNNVTFTFHGPTAGGAQNFVVTQI